MGPEGHGIAVTPVESLLEEGGLTHRRRRVETQVTPRGGGGHAAPRCTSQEADPDQAERDVAVEVAAMRLEARR